MKKITAILLSLLLTLSMVPVNSLAVEENNIHTADSEIHRKPSSEDSFEFDKESKTIKKYLGSEKDIVIPNEIDGVPVEKIGKNAFMPNKNKPVFINSIVLNDNLKSLEASAFNDLPVKNIFINDGLEFIGSGAFSRTKNLSEIRIPDSVTEIGTGAFIGSSIKSVTLSGNLKKIDDMTFSNCLNLENINIPDNITSIGSRAFLNCSKLSLKINVGPSFEIIKPYALKGCKDISINISDKGTPVVICENNLNYSGLTLNIPNTRSVFIANLNFSNPENSSINLGTIDVDKNLNTEQFKNILSSLPLKFGTTDKNLKPSTIQSPDWKTDGFDLSKSDSITATYKGCQKCGDNGIKITIRINKIQKDNSTPKEYFEFDKDSQSIVKYLPSGKNKDLSALSDVVLPDEIDGVSVKKIGKAAFLKSKINSITFNKSLSTVCFSAFSNSYVKKIIPNEGLKYIDNFAFSNCKNLEEFKFPESIVSIDNNAFKNCSKMNSEFTAGKNFTTLYSSAFFKCGNMKLNIADFGTPVDIFENNINISNSPFKIPNTRKIFLTEKAFLYKNPTVYLGELKLKNNISKSELKNALDSIPFTYGKTSFDNTSKKNVKHEKRIDFNLDKFRSGETKNLEVTVPSEMVESITFKIDLQYSSDKKDSVWTSDDFIYGNIATTLLNNPTFFGITGFSEKGKEKLKTHRTLDIPYDIEIKENGNKIRKKIRGIGANAFKGYGIENLNLPTMKDGYNKFLIEAGAFADNKLSELTLPEGIYAIDTFAFGNNNLKELYIPSTIFKIGNNAFKDNKIEKLNFSDDVYKIQLDNYSFKNNKIKEVHLPYSVFKIKHYVFQDNIGKNGDGVVYIYTRNPKHLTSETYIYPSKYQKFVLVSGNINREHLFETIRSTLSLNREEYRENSWNNMISALKDAKAVFKNEKASQSDIDNSNSILKKAIVNLKQAKLIKTQLEKEVVSTKGLNKNLYTEKSWSDLNSVLAKAELLLENSNAEQEDIDSATSELISSVEKLRIREEMKWNKSDFTYNGNIITGYSNSGKEKYKVNKFLVIPDTSVDGKSIKEIGKSAFKTTDGVIYRTDDVKSPLGLKSVEIPNTVEKIDADAFRQNNLSHIALPDSLKEIGDTAFNANQLKEVSIPDSVIKMGAGCFSLNLIEKVKFSKSMKEIPDGVLSRNIYLKSVEIPDGVKRIGKSAFVGAPLTEINLPSSVELVDYKAFSGQRCKEIKIPGNVKKIEKLAFEENVKFRHTKKLVLEEGVEEIGQDAFKSCLLSEVLLPDSIKKIHKEAFKDNLDDMKSPVTVRLISKNPAHADLFENNSMQKIVINTKVEKENPSSTAKIISRTSKTRKKYENTIKNKVTRLSGRNRIETANRISSQYFSKADNVVLVSAYNLSDSLISPVQAEKFDSPILLSDNNALSDSTLKEIKRLKASKVTIIGGENSISKNIEKTLNENNLSVNRISGSDRYETSVKLAENLYKDNKYSDIFIVDGTNISDGLSVANLSTKLKAPVLLTKPESIGNSAADFISKNKIKKVHIVGGTDSVSLNIENKLKNFNVDRISGSDRYETSKKVAKIAYPALGSLHLASGKNGIDALVCGAIISKTSSPMVLVNDSDSSFSQWCRDQKINEINIIGGVSSISDTFAEKLKN